MDVPARRNYEEHRVKVSFRGTVRYEDLSTTDVSDGSTASGATWGSGCAGLDLLRLRSIDPRRVAHIVMVRVTCDPAAKSYVERWVNEGPAKRQASAS